MTNNQLVSHRKLPVFRLNSIRGRLSNPAYPARDIATLLAPYIQDLPKDAPIVIMVHGYNFSPLRTKNCPHATIYAEQSGDPTWAARSWPNQLANSKYYGTRSLKIAFAWDARSSVFMPSAGLSDVYDRCVGEGRQLAKLINILSKIAPTRKIDILAHSLGARVALQSLHSIQHHNLGRVIMMGGAEFSAVALNAIHAKAAKTARFYNITSRQNHIYDALFENIAECPGPSNRSIGFTFPFQRSNWINIPIDNPKMKFALETLGLPLNNPRHRICRWCFDTRPGVYNMYQAIFARKNGMEINGIVDAMQQSGATPSHAPRRELLPFPMSQFVPRNLTKA